MKNLIFSHKDSKPEETIRRIRDILFELDIMPYEEWRVFSENCYSVRITDSQFPAATNGKGTSRLYTLASAYAEFMERLQNGLLYKREMGVMPGYEFFAADEVMMATEAVWENQPHVCSSLTELDKSRAAGVLGEKIRTAPFYHVNTGQVEYLPMLLIQHAYGSTGMCAGNTPAEALCQGLCEVFERFAVREVFLKELELPTIPLEMLKETKVAAMIGTLQALGYSCVVKDCSLGGTVPVVAVAAFNENRAKFKMAFGSDPIFEVALHRCMTELVQGMNQEEFKNFMLPLHLERQPDAAERLVELLRFVGGGIGRCSAKSVLHEGEAQMNGVFKPQFVSSEDSLGYVLGLILDSGYQVYARDVSFLGFPSYQVYIPGLSEAAKLDEKILNMISKRSKPAQQCLLDLRSASTDSIRQCIEFMESLMDTPFFSHMYKHGLPNTFVTSLAGLCLDGTCQFYRLHNYFLLATMSSRIGDYRRAFNYLNAFLDSEEAKKLPNLGYARCALMYFKLKSDEWVNDHIERSLVTMFGPQLAQAVLNDLRNPEKSFQYMLLPACNNCSACSVSRYCNYERWKHVMAKLKKRMSENPIDQLRLSEILKS